MHMLCFLNKMQGIYWLPVPPWKENVQDRKKEQEWHAAINLKKLQKTDNR